MTDEINITVKLAKYETGVYHFLQCTYIKHESQELYATIKFTIVATFLFYSFNARRYKYLFMIFGIKQLKENVFTQQNKTAAEW